MDRVPTISDGTPSEKSRAQAIFSSPPPNRPPHTSIGSPTSATTSPAIFRVHLHYDEAEQNCIPIFTSQNPEGIAAATIGAQMTKVALADRTIYPLLAVPITDGEFQRVRDQGPDELQARWERRSVDLLD